jgi:hypothetical protein
VIAVTILDIIQRLTFYLNHNVTETEFCLRLQLEPTQFNLLQLVSVRRHILAISIGFNSVGSTRRRTQNPISETLDNARIAIVIVTSLVSIGEEHNLRRKYVVLFQVSGNKLLWKIFRTKKYEISRYLKV